MRVCTCFLLLEIFAYIHSAAPDTPRANDRSVKLALETVLEFSDKDKTGDITILDNVRNFITKVKTAIDKTNNVERDARRDITAPTVDSFTGFIREVVKIINTYDNTTFKNFFDDLDEQIRKYHYRGCKFHELADNSELRKLIMVKLDSIKRTPAPVIKANINTLSKMLKNGNYDKNNKEIVDNINSLYRHDDGVKFQKVLSDLSAYGKLKSKKSDTNLSKIIRNGVRSIVFDHYTNLSTKVRRKFKWKIENFFKKLKENPQSKGNKRNAKTSDNIVNEVKKSKPILIKYTASKKANAKILTKQENNEESAKVKQLNYKNEMEKKLSPQGTGPTVPQRAKIKSQEQSSYIDASSLEFYQEPKVNTRQNKAMNFDKISQKTNSRKKYEIIKSVNLTTRSPAKNTNQNIWIEESTGRLPQAVLDKLAVKARRHESDYYNATEAVNKRGTKHNKKYDKKRKSWHRKIYEPKLGNGYNKKHETKRMTKHRPKYGSLYHPGRPGLIPSQKSKKVKKLKSDRNTQLSEPTMLIHNKDLFKKNDDSTTKSVFNMKRNQYKKNMEPISNELNSRQDDDASGAATQAKNFLELLDVQMTPGKFVPSRTETPRRYDGMSRIKTAAEFASQKDHSNRNKMLSRKFAAKRFEIKHDKRSELKEAQKSQPLTSLEKDLHVIRKIKNLEKEIQAVKSIMNEPNVNKDKRKQYETKSGLDAQRFINDSKRRQDMLEMAGTAYNKTELIIKNENIQETSSKNNNKKDNIEEAESQINVNADAAFMKAREYTVASQMTQYALLQTTQTANNKKEFLIKPVKGKDFKSIDINKKSESKFRSNDIRDRTEEANVTSTSDNKTDIVETDIDFNDNDSKNNEIKDNTREVQSKNNVNADIVKMKENSNAFEMMRDRLLKRTGTTNKNIELLIKQVKDHDLKKIGNGKTSETLFRSNVNIPNDFKEKADNAKLTRIVDKKTVMINKYSKMNDIKESINETKSKVNGQADVVEVIKSQQSNETNKIKSKVSEIKSTPDHTRIINDSKMARTAGSKTEAIQALNYNKLKDSLEKTKNKIIIVDDMKTREVKPKDPPKEIKGKPKQSGPSPGLEANKKTNSLDDNQDTLMDAAKNMLIRPVVDKYSKTSKTKLRNINKTIEPEASFRSDGNKVLNDVQNTTGITNATGTDNQTNITERNNSSKINDYQTTTSTKQQKIMKEDKKTETSVNTEDGKIMMRVGADDKATTGTKTGEKQLESTTSIAPTPTKSTAATTKGSTTTVVPTTPNTLKSSPILVVSPAATSSKLPPLPVVWKTNKPL